VAVVIVLVVVLADIKMQIEIKKLDAGAKLPSYSHRGDAGADLYSNEDALIASGDRYLMHTGISMAIPKGYVGLIWDRSGMALKNGMHVLAGVIDSGYRGEIGVVLKNLDKEKFRINKGDRIAQILIQSVEEVEFKEVKDISETIRNEKGFGSTGD
jgi:dUTP pyrophosphatase